MSMSHHDSNNLFLQHENHYAVWGISPEQQAIGHYSMKVAITNHSQGSCYMWFN
jgi:hypothetical protein